MARQAWGRHRKETRRADSLKPAKHVSHLSKLWAVLAATSGIVLSATAANAAVAVSRPTINIAVPRPTVSVAVPKATVPAVSTAAPTRQIYLSRWQHNATATTPYAAGTQDTVLFYQNGKVVSAISSISLYPATRAVST
jgi:hypothetical protein